MTTIDKISAMQNLKETGTIASEELPDDLNPIYLFSTTHKQLLLDIANGKIDARELARRELEARGINNKGVFVRINYLKSK